MIVSEPVFETVLSPALFAVHTRDQRRVDESFAGGIGALLFVGEDGRFRREWES
jgi:hypothetical protein